MTWPGSWNELGALIGLGRTALVGLVHVGSLIPRAAASDASAVLASFGRGIADAHLVEDDGGAGRDRGAGVGGGPGHGDGNDFTYGLESWLGVESDGGLNVPLALAARADVLFGAAELELGPLAINKTAWNVAAKSMVSVPGIELASWRSMIESSICSNST